MGCYLVRHGKDDESVRGGWSDSALTDEGIAQSISLAARLKSEQIRVSVIYTSDLPRAKQTAQILAEAISVPVEERQAFRETNNGVLAGMDNALALRRYPGLYWSALDWDQCYPGGESPHQFFDRIAKAWEALKEEIICSGCDAVLVTHGGVVNCIQCIETGIIYSNKDSPFPLGYAQKIYVPFALDES